MSEPWTEEDLAIVAGMKRAGIPNRDIAKRLGRSEAATAQACQKLKAYRRLDHRRGAHVTPVFRPTVR